MRGFAARPYHRLRPDAKALFRVALECMKVVCNNQRLVIRRCWGHLDFLTTEARSQLSLLEIP